MYHLKRRENDAFDISPVNTVLNFYSNQLGFDYDDKISTTGLINNSLLNELNNLDFINKHIKSLGFEFVKQTVIDYRVLEIDITDK
jgi:anhydro-N-acetylmuramic acid kinase